MSGVSPVPRISWPCASSSRAQLAEVVELAVEDATTSPRSLATGWSPVCEIDDREAPVAEHGAAERRDGSSGRGRDVRSPRSCARPPRVGRVPAEESADPAHARYARLRGRVVPRRKAARRPRSGSATRDLAMRAARRLRDRVAAAAAGRRRGRGAVRRARPRGGGARAVRPPHALDVADRTRARRAATRPSRCCARAAGCASAGSSRASSAAAAGTWTRSVMARRRRARVRRLHRDRGAAGVPPARLAARRARRGRRGCASTTAAACSSCRARTRSAPPRKSLAGSLPPVVHVHFHDYELLDARRRGGALAHAARCSRAAAGRSSPARSRPSARSRGPTCAPTDAARGARRDARGLRRLGSAAAAAAGPRREGRQETRSGSASSGDGKTVVSAGAATRGCATSCARAATVTR